MLHWYAQAYGLRYAALRYFNAAGADPDGEVGEDARSGDAPHPARDRGGGRRAASSQIFGTDYPTPDGTAIRDYIHVVDLADAHLRALAKLRDGTPALRLNLGTGQGHSVREVGGGGRARSRAGRCRAREVGRRAGDPPALVADARQAGDVLGWKPRYPELETIVEHAVRWRDARQACVTARPGSSAGIRCVRNGSVVAAHRQNRPWTGGTVAAPAGGAGRPYDPDCYLCPGNARVGGARNPRYDGTFVFDNDHPCVGPGGAARAGRPAPPYRVAPAAGARARRLLLAAPRSDAGGDAAGGDRRRRRGVAARDARSRRPPGVKQVLCFENKGEVVGVSNPHPHGQIYATGFVWKTMEIELGGVGAPPGRDGARPDGRRHPRRAARRRPARPARGRARDRVRPLLRPLRLRGLRRAQAPRPARVRAERRRGGGAGARAVRRHDPVRQSVADVVSRT